MAALRIAIARMNHADNPSMASVAVPSGIGQRATSPTPPRPASTSPAAMMASTDEAQMLDIAASSASRGRGASKIDKAAPAASTPKALNKSVRSIRWLTVKTYSPATGLT